MSTTFITIFTIQVIITNIVTIQILDTIITQFDTEV